MLPTLAPGNRLLVDWRAEPAVGAIVVVEFDDGVVAVKRLTAVSGADCVVESDNDIPGARSGIVDRSQVRGRAVLRLWPPVRRFALGNRP